MSSHDVSRRRLLTLGASAAASLALGGCLRPLYGVAANGRSVADELAAIDVPEIPERLGHYLRTELLFLLDGSGATAPKRYRLSIYPTATLLSAVVDAVAARVDAATLSGNAPFTLAAIDTGAPILVGTAIGTATYERSPQRYATIRAARDAEIRLGRMLAEQIRTRVAATFAARTS